MLFPFHFFSRTRCKPPAIIFPRLWNCVMYYTHYIFFIQFLLSIGQITVNLCSVEKQISQFTSRFPSIPKNSREQNILVYSNAFLFLKHRLSICCYCFFSLSLLLHLLPSIDNVFVLPLFEILLAETIFWIRNKSAAQPSAIRPIRRNKIYFPFDGCVLRLFPFERFECYVSGIVGWDNYSIRIW